MTTLEQQLPETTFKQKLLNNLSSIGIIKAFPIQQKLIQTNVNQNVFIQSPCGTGKTLAAILPYCISESPCTVLFLTSNDLLKIQALNFFNAIFNGISDVQVIDDNIDIIVKPIIVTKKVFIICTILSLRQVLHLTQKGYYIQQNIVNDTYVSWLSYLKPKIRQNIGLNYYNKLHIIVDEADKQVLESPMVFQELFKAFNIIQQCEQDISINNSAYINKRLQKRCNFMFLSATLRLNQAVFNGLNVTLGEYIQASALSDNKDKIIIIGNIQSDLERFDALLNIINSEFVKFPILAFVTATKSLKSIVKHMLNARGIENILQNVKINVLNPDITELQGDILCVNQQITGQMIAFTDGQLSRGFDNRDIQTVITDDEADVSELIHRVGRAGRGELESIRIIMSTNSPNPEFIQEVQQDNQQLQIFQNYEQFKTEILCFENDKKDQIKAIGDFIKQYNLWWEEMQYQDQTDLYDIIQGMQQDTQ